MKLKKASVRQIQYSFLWSKNAEKFDQGALWCLCVCGNEPDSILGSAFFLIILKIISGDDKSTAVHLKDLITFSKIVIICWTSFQADFTLKK